MENEQTPQPNSALYYVIGAIVLVSIVGAGFLLKPKGTNQPAQTGQMTQEPPTPTPTPGPITGLACDSQYYNPVIGFEKYYLSVEGGDVSEAEKVDCTITASVDDKVVQTAKVSSPLTDAPVRGGATFRCTTQGLELAADTPTVVDVVLKDDLGTTATCSASFLFPAP